MRVCVQFLFGSFDDCRAGLEPGDIEKVATRSARVASANGTKQPSIPRLGRPIGLATEITAFKRSLQTKNVNLCFRVRAA
jgi:hypothetical protein